MYEDRSIVGLTERIILNGKGHKKIDVKARIDSGATKSSIDINLAKTLKLGPVVKSKIVKSAHGKMRRPIVWAEIVLAGKKIKSMFTLADRNHMKYKVLIGQNILKKGFLIDPMLK